MSCQYPYITVWERPVNIHICTHKPAHHLLCSWHKTFPRPSLIHILCRRIFVLKKQKWCFDLLTVVDKKIKCRTVRVDTYMPVQLFPWDSINTYYHVFHLEKLKYVKNKGNYAIMPTQHNQRFLHFFKTIRGSERRSQSRCNFYNWLE